VERRLSAVALLMCDIVESTALTNRLGDLQSAQLFEHFDWIARNLLHIHDGREIDRTDGFFLIFYRAEAAVRYAEDLHEALAQFSSERREKVTARVGIHFAEIYLRHNPGEHVARGAKPIEAEGLAKPVTARIMSLAIGGQTLISGDAVGMAKRAIHSQPDLETWAWASYGDFSLKGLDAPVSVWEAGRRHRAPMQRPFAKAAKAPIEKRAVLAAIAGAVWTSVALILLGVIVYESFSQQDSCRIYLEDNFDKINRGYIVLEDGGTYRANIEGSLLEFECLPQGTKISAVVDVDGNDGNLVHIPDITLGPAGETTTISLTDAKDGSPANFEPPPEEKPYFATAISAISQSTENQESKRKPTSPADGEEKLVHSNSNEPGIEAAVVGDEDTLPEGKVEKACMPHSNRFCAVQASNMIGSCTISGTQTCNEAGTWSGCFGSCSFDIKYSREDTCCIVMRISDEVPQYDPKTGKHSMGVVEQHRKQQYACPVECKIEYICSIDSAMTTAACKARSSPICAPPPSLCN
jgi:class 3 adenylate cyclase